VQIDVPEELDVEGRGSFYESTGCFRDMVSTHLCQISDEVDRLWQICEPVLESPPTAIPYQKGSWGPEEALELPGAAGWRLPVEGHGTVDG
jgi:glucose-6-phosphate 1-dehydrogenase